MHRIILTFIASLAIAACTVGPDYKKPDTTEITPAKWRWQTATPSDAQPRGEWWKAFHDSELSRLENLAVSSSPSLVAAVARVDQARAAARISTSGWLPDIRLKGAVEREQTSGNLPTPVPVNIPPARINSFNTLFDLSYEIDFWGKVRREVESARATAAAAEASYHSALLTLTGDVAAQYFMLRSFDAELSALRRTIDLREKWQTLLDEKFKAGTIPETDLARAQTEVAMAKADLAEAKRQRQEASDALALLCGQPASAFSISERPITVKGPPVIPAGVPAGVLERRPDIAAAERIVAARNADLGVAKAAYFPTVRLTGTGGYLSKDVDSLLTADSKVWSIGPSINVPVSGWAVIKFNVKRVTAAREEAIANYRQAILAAINDVETSLTQIRHRAEQAKAVGDALTAATKATDLIRASYERGSISYLELLDAERTRLQAELQTARIAAQRQISTVRLIKAIGGAW
ncbi:MAG: efflux transporter outer membrane subunit [Verrucomicrobiales bacterium]|nr:efflux transporter outer membrane subunit [Verrucomicrobiales bacterium]MCP5557417.1 efflux transporter outer membrane subunit [Verrucomicrobiaceae bacterium]